MSRLTDLLKQARDLDAQLGADLEAEFRALRGQRTFGLVFERPHPDTVELPGRQIRRGDWRIESVAETDGKLRVLDLKLERVQPAVRDAHDAKALYRSEIAADY